MHVIGANENFIIRPLLKRLMDENILKTIEKGVFFVQNRLLRSPHRGLTGAEKVFQNDTSLYNYLIIYFLISTSNYPYFSKFMKKKV